MLELFSVTTHGHFDYLRHNSDHGLNTDMKKKVFWEGNSHSTTDTRYQVGVID